MSAHNAALPVEGLAFFVVCMGRPESGLTEFARSLWASRRFFERFDGRGMAVFPVVTLDLLIHFSSLFLFLKFGVDDCFR